MLLPGSPLGLLTEGVQVLAGVLLPRASVFLLLLCNDKDVLGPWVNGRKTNMFTAAVVAILVTLSVILTASVLFPAITAGQILAIVAACGAASLAAAGYAAPGYPLKRSGNWSCISAVRQGRVAAGRSRLGGWPVPRWRGGLLRGFVVARMSW